MKGFRKVIFIFSFVALCCIVTVPAQAATPQAGYRFTCDCALGNGVEFFIPANNASGSLSYDTNGILMNITSSTINLYSPAYPDYTFSASRFSGFTYRTSNYDTRDLNIRNVKTQNVEIFTEDPALADRTDVLELFHVMITIGSFAVEFLLLLKWRNVRV